MDCEFIYFTGSNGSPGRCRRMGTSGSTYIGKYCRGSPDQCPIYWAMREFHGSSGTGRPGIPDRLTEGTETRL